MIYAEDSLSFPTKHPVYKAASVCLMDYIILTFNSVEYSESTSSHFDGVATVVVDWI